jgi:hypothetical protein
MESTCASGSEQQGKSAPENDSIGYRSTFAMTAEKSQA